MGTRVGLRKLSLFFAHPRWLIAIAILGAFLSAGYGLTAIPILSVSQVWTSVFVGVATGLPAVLGTKRLIRKHLRSYAEFSLLVATDFLCWAFWKSHANDLLIPLPMFFSLGAAWILSRHLQIPWVMGIGWLSLLFLLAYPEQEQAYLLAKARLGESC